VVPLDSAQQLLRPDEVVARAGSCFGRRASHLERAVRGEGDREELARRRRDLDHQPHPVVVAGGPPEVAAVRTGQPLAPAAAAQQPHLGARRVDLVAGQHDGEPLARPDRPVFDVHGLFEAEREKAVDELVRQLEQLGGRVTW
jgi:hypothetical protein